MRHRANIEYAWARSRIYFFYGSQSRRGRGRGADVRAAPDACDTDCVEEADEVDFRQGVRQGAHSAPVSVYRFKPKERPRQG